MAALSGWITRGQLIHEASERVATLRSTGPLWHWHLRRESDVVASRVFGAADLAVVPDGLEITSRDGTPFEIGLPLVGPVDLGRWPLLRLAMHGNKSGALGLIYQPAETNLPCSADGVASLPTGDTPVTIDLRKLHWHTSDGAPCAAPAVVAYMLRLRVSLPAAATLSLHSASLSSPESISLPATIGHETADIQLPETGSILSWAPSTEQQQRHSAPVVRLSEGASSETMLLSRDRVLRFWPAAIILPHGQALPITTATHMPAWLDVGVCCLYLAWLIWLAARQRPGVVRPWIEVAAIAAGPLWLIAGLRWSPEPSLSGVVAFLAALVYGGQSEWRRRPVDWSWWGKDWRDWLLPMVPVPVALALMLADGHHLVHLEPRHILAYLAWALLQQWAMLALVMGRLERTGLPRAAMVVVTATLFGLLHTPNGSLMQLCLLAELWWAWCFMRSPRLVPIALAHAASALLVEAGLTGHLLRSLEVSARFFL
ncbi:CPBP family glutamic-type intramembrane protease [Dyella sp. C11]|uniref:CPBP family glutamic-type intramembrane protease n=1 Tax=Dyella sp. C11 TaxID=2126991 RepID=UPI000D64898D|nr:CPBP family glutamic-type intramembrane protease [Dyella sp. C11]